MYLLSINDTNLENEFFHFCRHNDVNCPDHLHYSVEIVCVTEGKLTMTVNEKEWTINEGEGIIILPFEKHSFLSKEHNRCFVLGFSPRFSQDFYALIKDKAVDYPLCSIKREIFALCSALLPLDSYEDILVPQVKARAIIYPLVSEFFEKCEFKESKMRYDSAFVEALRYVLENCYGGDVSLDATAKALGYHKVYLSRTFKKSSGMSFVRYVNSVRCAYAIRCIKNDKSVSIAEVAFRAGFGSIRNFNREFKQLYGVSPSAVYADEMLDFD